MWYHLCMKTHDYTAYMDDSGAVKVRDSSDEDVRVLFSGRKDGKELRAYVPGIGYIGGWRYPAAAQPFGNIVEYINKKRIYKVRKELPRSCMKGVERLKG